MPADEVDEADEADNERACLVDLVEDRLRVLKGLKIKDLRGEAVARSGLSREQINEETEDADDRKAAIVQLLFKTVVTTQLASPNKRSKSSAR